MLGTNMEKFEFFCTESTYTFLLCWLAQGVQPKSNRREMSDELTWYDICSRTLPVA